ncbi:MAG: Na+/H+ antiporter [Candidatus Eremiobacteraeota bacterium]|nr:Na+/H+ antiporter [Candidatus Eremiobacteraeota bacterium]
MQLSLLLFGLLGAIIVLSVLARRFRVPYPVVFVIAGALIAFVPHLPDVKLQPDLVFLIVLPPLLFGGGWQTDWYEFRRNVRPIGILAIGLVIVSTLIIGSIAHALMTGITWAAAFALGAIVAPPDAVAAEAVLERLAVPRRVAAILGGESLVNDASALVVYRFAIVAAVSGSFSLAHAFGSFILVSVGGIAIGLAVALALEAAERFLVGIEAADSLLVNVVILLAPYAAYLPAEAAHVSGVLAVVTAGMYLGRKSARIADSETRLIGSAVWQMLTLVLNGAVFLAIGLQLRGLIGGLSGSRTHIAADAVAICAAVIVIRLVWVFAATYSVPLLARHSRERVPLPSWRSTLIVAWSGMRGIVSLAAALALPYAVAGGAAFPGRSEIIFITFCVIFATLVLQGFTLGPLIEWLGISERSARERQETQVRIQALESGIARLHQLEPTFDSTTDWEVAGRLLGEYEHRIHHLRGHLEDDGSDIAAENRADHRLQKEALDAERRAIMRMRGRGEIPDDVFRNIQYDLDLADMRLA